MSARAKEIQTFPLPLADDALELRAQRTWLIVDVMSITWAFFSIYLYVRGYPLASLVCFLECGVYVVLVAAFRKTSHYRLVTELWLISCGIGVVTISASDLALSNTIFYFPISIMVASQLFGVRQAFIWLLASVVAIVGFFVASFGLIGALTTWHCDAMLISVGTAVCLFLCVYQAESHYQSKTNGLVSLSDDLRDQASYLEVLATTDSLTGLHNRLKFTQDLSSQLAKNEHAELALFLIDMDGFKEVNDTLGHPVGDEVLVEIGKRLGKAFSSRAIVSRLGGDEFCITYTGIANVAAAEEVASELHELLTDKYVIDDNQLCLGASIGFALAPLHSRNEQDLIAFADTAMFRAKESGKKFACYDQEMTERLSEVRVLKAKLASALAENEFHLVYQPQVDIATGKLTGVEALIRWQHHGETISPMVFIPLLEQTGKIVEVGRWIISEACRQQARWCAQGWDLRMSVNLSAVQFRDSGLSTYIAAALKEYGVVGNRLDLEITEGLLIDDVEDTIETLNRIKELGPTVSIDDFGTGYSSLAYLQRLPIDRLKIDRAFIKDVPESDDGSLAGSIVSLGETLGVTVLAEGVESEIQLEILRQYGCDEYQGYFFSRPTTPDEVAALCDGHGCVSDGSPENPQVELSRV